MMGKEYEPLFPAGFHDILESSLEKLFVEPFGSGNERRAALCGGLRAWLGELKGTGVRAEVWVDGSFVTFKPYPNDVDIVCVIDRDSVYKLDYSMRSRLAGLFYIPAIKLGYGCHTFYFLGGDADNFNRWAKRFGCGRDGMPKGIPKILVGGELCGNC